MTEEQKALLKELHESLLPLLLKLNESNDKVIEIGKSKPKLDNLTSQNLLGIAYNFESMLSLVLGVQSKIKTIFHYAENKEDMN